MTHSLFAVVVGIAHLSVVAHAAGQSAPTSQGRPPGRGHHVLFYDEARQRVMLTGGAANDARRNVIMFDDLWSFDGSAWTSLVASNGAVFGARIAVDATNRIHAFGGYRDAPTGELRVLQDNRWQIVNVHPSITANEPGFVFDRKRQRFVAFGGGSASGRMNGDVWEYDGTQWSKDSTPAPPARGSHAMIYDQARDRTVVFGGIGTRTGEQSAPVFGDTWEFDGTKWTEKRVAGPPARLGAGVAYDSKRRLVILFGGADHEKNFNDLWSWDGTSWKKLSESGPEPRVMGYIAYDKRRDRIVLFGGRLRNVSVNADLGDTWEWDGVAWRKIG